jgi:hypothetical protein
MKLRIRKNSLRLRVSPSELARLIETGRIEETIHFTAESGARLTYALEHAEAQAELSVRYRPQEVTVVVSTGEARKWAEGEQVGIYGDVGAEGCRLVLAVEKDFACLDGSDRDNQDRFANPRRGTKC